MHNCKITRENLIDLALAEAHAGVSAAARSDGRSRLLAQLAACSDCRAEYAALRRTLSIVDEAAQDAIPSENFWPGYHSRLSQQLKTAALLEATKLPSRTRTAAGLWSTLKNLAGTSVRIPVPVAALLLILFGLSLFLLLPRGRAELRPLPPVAVVETKTIEVPVITERVVTRVVYVARNRRSGPARPEANGAPDLSSAAARLPKDSASTAAVNLSGFRPPDQVKLTIIKGSYRDEK